MSLSDEIDWIEIVIEDVWPLLQWMLQSKILYWIGQ